VHPASLQDLHGGGLVHHGPLLATAHPRSLSVRTATTVDNRSSDIRTGTGISAVSASA